jgi:hypothetical protein
MLRYLFFAVCVLMMCVACGTDSKTDQNNGDDVRSSVDQSGSADLSGVEDGEPAGPDLPPQPTDCKLDVDCDDGNPCTDGSCDGGQCVYVDTDGEACDDGDACTLDDICLAGSCSSEPIDCEDDLECTIDTCVEGECKTKLSDELACELKIQVDTPERAQTFHAGGAVEVAGKVVSPVGPVQFLKLNGDKVTVKSNGSFSTAIFADPGINVLEFNARDSYDRNAKTVRSFLFAEELYQVGNDKAIVYMADAARVFLSAEVWDDDNSGDVDDIATVVYAIVNTLDVDELIPSGIVYSATVLGATCTWTIDISQVDFALQTIDLDPALGVLKLKGGFINFEAWIDAVAPWCPDGHGWVTAEKINFDAELEVKVANGSVIVELGYIDVEVVGIDVDLVEGLASYFDWVVGWFDGTFASLIEEKLETLLPEKVVPMLVSLLNEFLEKEQEIPMPPIPGTTSGLPLVLKTYPEDADLSAAGTAFTVSVGIGSKKLVPHDAPGTFKRGDCKGQDTGQFYLPKAQKLEAAVSEDLVNQILFQLWWGGHFTATITSDILDPLLADFDITGLVVKLDPFLPPLYTSCTPTGVPELQIGDINVWASFSMGSQNGEVELFASIKVAAEVQAAAGALGLAVGEVSKLGLDVVMADGMMKGNEELLEQLLTEVLVNILIKDYLADVLAAYPIPVVNLGALAPDYFPAGTVVKFKPTGASASHGYLLLTGETD